MLANFSLYALMALAQQQRADAEEFYASSPPDAEWTYRLLGAYPGGVWEWVTPYDAAERDTFYAGMQKAMQLKGVTHYASPFEGWIGGAQNPNRIEGFMIVAADAQGNTLAHYFQIDRSGPHARLIPQGTPQTGWTGAAVTLLR